jgi:hypothetical protein
MKPQFEKVLSRISIDNAIFTFGMKNEDGTRSFRLFCAGMGNYYVETIDPLSEEQLLDLIDSLKQLSPQNSKFRIKINASRFMNIILSFRGFDVHKGYKVKTYLKGIFNFSMSGFFSSYCSENDIARLITNLDEHYKNAVCT